MAEDRYFTHKISHYTFNANDFIKSDDIVIT
jgi:hypothetical protein